MYMHICCVYVAVDFRLPIFEFAKFNSILQADGTDVPLMSRTLSSPSVTVAAGATSSHLPESQDGSSSAGMAELVCADGTEGPN